MNRECGAVAVDRCHLHVRPHVLDAVPAHVEVVHRWREIDKRVVVGVQVVEEPRQRELLSAQAAAFLVSTLEDEDVETAARR